MYGGRSGEHEVSLASAAAIFANLDRARYEPVPIRIEPDGRWCLADRAPTLEHARVNTARRIRSSREVHPIAHPGDDTMLLVERGVDHNSATDDEGQAIVSRLALDVIFPIVHGPYGEDGTLQGLFELANIPYVGAGVTAAAVGMDKAMMKTVFAASGLPIVNHETVRRRDWQQRRQDLLAALATRLRYPLFVKPANLGSSVGISRATDDGLLSAAIDHAAEFDRKIIVEEGVTPCREIECAVMGNDDPVASVPGEVIPAGDFYDYQAKYLDDRSETIVPAEISETETREVRRLAQAAFRAIDGAGMARVDFLINGVTGRLFVNEINTHPGFTTISMFAKLWEATGVSYPALLDRLIALATERHKEKQQTRTSA